MIRIIDTHSHFNLPQFDTDRDEAITRMETHGVATICVGIDYATSVYAVSLAQEHESIWAIVGQHPTHWQDRCDIEAFKQLISQPRVVGVGECGLDYFRDGDRAKKQEQRTLFITQIILAGTAHLPLMLHIRPQAGTMDAYDDALEILREYKKQYPDLSGTAHFFVGDIRVAQAFLDLGFYISFSGVVTIFPEYKPLVAFVPHNRILVETDAPFAAPLPWRGKRSEPWQVAAVIDTIAEEKGETAEQVIAQVRQNTKDLFGI